MPRRRVLLVFTRSPEAEARAKGFGGRKGAPLFRALLDSWVRLAREAGVEILLASPAACRARLERSGIAPAARFLTQPRAPFGERLAAATRDAFALGFDAAVVVAADAPAIPPGDLRRAFEAAEAGAVALGPATDGGVYLIGMSARDAEIGRRLRLRDGRALVRLLSEIAGRGRGVVLLPPREEVDSAPDAARARRLAAIDPRWAPYRFLLGVALGAPGEGAAPGARPSSLRALRRKPPRGPPAAA